MIGRVIRLILAFAIVVLGIQAGAAMNGRGAAQVAVAEAGMDCEAPDCCDSCAGRAECSVVCDLGAPLSGPGSGPVIDATVPAGADMWPPRSLTATPPAPPRPPPRS